MKSNIISTAGPNDEIEERALELLEQVNLRSFQATPQALLPFQSSLLRWQVEAPTGVSIKLNGSIVSKSATKLIQPTATQTFRLYAHVSRYSRFLAAVTVSVNLTQCTSRNFSTIDELLDSELIRGINASDEVYFRLVQVLGPDGRKRYVQSQPEVTILPGRIRFKLKLGGEVNNFPNPDINVDASFGLGIAQSSAPDGGIFPQNVIVATAVDVNVSVSFPWWAYLVPGAAIGLPIAAGMAQDRVRAEFTNAITRFVAEGVNPLFNLVEPAGTEKHRIRIFVSDQVGIVEVDYCPVPQPEVVIQ
jgi:hypothetical protein